MASNAENVSIWWRHHVLRVISASTPDRSAYYIWYIIAICLALFIYDSKLINHSFEHAYSYTLAIVFPLTFVLFSYEVVQFLNITRTHHTILLQKLPLYGHSKHFTSQIAK